MKTHALVDSELEVQQEEISSTKTRAKRVWQGERFGDLFAVGAAVLVLGGTYLLVSQWVLPTLARGFSVVRPGF